MVFGGVWLIEVMTSIKDSAFQKDLSPIWKYLIHNMIQHIRYAYIIYFWLDDQLGITYCFALLLIDVDDDKLCAWVNDFIVNNND